MYQKIELERCPFLTRVKGNKHIHSERVDVYFFGGYFSRDTDSMVTFCNLCLHAVNLRKCFFPAYFWIEYYRKATLVSDLYEVESLSLGFLEANIYQLVYSIFKAVYEASSRARNITLLKKLSLWEFFKIFVGPVV